MNCTIKENPFLNTLFLRENKELSSLNIYNEEVLVVEITGESRKLLSRDFVPLQTENFSIFIVKSGECTIQANYISYHLDKNTYIVLREKLLISELYFSEDLTGYLIIIKKGFLLTALGNNIFSSNEVSEKKIVLPVVIKCENDDFLRLEEFVLQLIKNINVESHRYKYNLIQNSLSNFILELWNISSVMFSEDIQQSKSLNIQTKLSFQFIHILQANYKEMREVSDYAKELNLSPTHLSRILKRVTGKTASEWICEVMTNEIKLRLHNPDKSIQAIAEELNFSDQASLSKFFKRNTGESPSTYRNELSLKF